MPAHRACRTGARVIDRFDLWREGAHAIWLEGDGRVRIETVRARQGERPWVPRRDGKPKRAGDGRAPPPDEAEEAP